MKRILSGLLAVIMIAGCFGYVSALPVNAAYSDKVDENGDPLINYIMEPYYTKEQKLADMVMMKSENGYQIWVEEFTGEVAFINEATGEAMFTNPYDLATNFTNLSAGSISKNVKQKLLSQIILTYEDNGSTKTMNSYVEAALRGQINIKNIKGGIRVEYTMGEQEVTRLVPRIISKERYETLIYANIQEGGKFVINKFDGFYSLKDKDDPSLSKKALNEMFTKFPITQTMAVYVCSPEITSNELSMLEGWIKQYCPLYTYEEMDLDHEETGYVGTDEAPPLFRLALEYKIQTDGSLEVRLPSNGIRYDETAYTLKDISILPYMGAGSNEDTGYSFVPDGTGALYRFEDLIGHTYNKAAQLYGDDYAYHTISENSVHSEVWRYPVFGVASYADRKVEYTETITPGYTDEDGTVVPPVTEQKEVYINEDKGFLAVITEGDSLTTLFSENGGTQHPYSSVYPKFTPHPSDSYNLADSISVADNKTWTVTSESKFTGSYRIKYIMLHDSEKVPPVDTDDLYECSYVGMAKAYRDYLYDTNQLNKLESNEVVENTTPLFIESFGSIETVERVASFPVTVDTPLTTFEDIKTMYNELAAVGISNINFRLKGFTNGGMVSTVPYRVTWVDALGGQDGFEDLVDYATTNGFGVYPDFDFAYAAKDELFDGLSYRDHAVKTIDNRYTTKQKYDAAQQTFMKTELVAISPAVYDYFYETFSENYSKYSPMGISVSTLGTDLNSDFDEDDPYNREDCKIFTTDLLANLKDKFGKVMIDGGNAYTYQYADYIVNISTDSSNFMVASESVPFLGMVLHGALQCSGEPINMEGDVYYAILKAIENGYYLNFTLSYRNTEKLKDDEQLAGYYSVKYEYWKDDLIKYYNMLNDATKDLQTSLIVNHEFLTGSRVQGEDEIAADEAALKAMLDEVAGALRDIAISAENDQKLNDRLNGKPVSPESNVGPIESFYEQAMKDTRIVDYLESIKNRYTTTSGSLVRVEYEGNVSFILNYNSFDITVDYNGETYSIPALSFERIG